MAREQFLTKRVAERGTEIESLKAQLAEADRRAGEAERKMARLIDDERKSRSWLWERKSEEGYDDNTPFDDVWAAVRAERDRLRALLAADPVRADTGRLDWLDRVNAKTNDRNGNKYGWRFDINHNRAALADNHVPALSVRQAIDEAMAKTHQR